MADSVMNTNVPYIEPQPSTQADVLEYVRSGAEGMTFVHGKAGSGKTHLIRRIERETPGCCVLAPTNLAASLYDRATTIHSFFNKAFDDLDEGYQNPQNVPGRTLDLRFIDKVRCVRMLVIDEISMVRSDTFEMMDVLFRKALADDRPFGGVPVLMVGDLFQLPPVVSDAAVQIYLESEYGGIYFFHSHVVQDNMARIRLFELTKSYRQLNDPQFTRLLDTFRRPASLKETVGMIETLNSRVVADVPDSAITVASSNQEVRLVNSGRLAELPGTTNVLHAYYTVLKNDRSGYVQLRSDLVTGTEDVMPLIVPSSFEPVLEWKIGAKVMLTSSNRRSGYANGDFGVISGYNPVTGSFAIRLEKNGAVIAYPEFANQCIVDRYELAYNPRTHRLSRGSRYVQRTEQIPMKPAYAFTIHKSQGQTYDKVVIDLNSHIFAPGQLYVALSRAKSLDGLYLTRPVALSDIITDDSIYEFLFTLRSLNTPLPEPAPAPQPERSRHSKECADVHYGSFVAFVRQNESDESTRQFLLYVLDAYRQLLSCGKPAMAYNELVKTVRLIDASYITDRYDTLMRRMLGVSNADNEDCFTTLYTIFEIYTDVVRMPRNVVASDSRMLPASACIK